jgi:hypothetical protein
MKTKMLLVAALIGAASLSARAGVHFGFVFGLPVPVPVVTVAAPVPVPVVEAVPACPTPGYVWAPGYWSGYGAARVWVGGGWRPGPHVVVYDHHYYGHRDYGHPWHR